MAEPRLDEFVAWSLDARGRIEGFAGARRPHRISRLSRFLLPGLDTGFAEPGHLLKIERVPLLRSHVAGLANLTRRIVVTAEPPRTRLQAAFVAAIPLPAVYSGYWWLLILSGLAAAATLFLFRESRLDLRHAAKEENASETLYRWRLLRSHIAPDAPPLPVTPEPTEAEWMERIALAYSGRLDDQQVEEIAVLPVPDGKLLACEPFQIHSPCDNVVPVPAGDHSVFVSVARFSDGQGELVDERVAYAWVRLREGVPARWEPARTRRGTEVEVGVDSGIAAFTSALAAPRFVRAYDRGDKWGYVEPLSDAIVAAMDEGGRGSAGRATLDVDSGARLVAFHSGFGDGLYPVLRALDKAGRRLAVAIDFRV
ncbi:MAG TPA: DUF4241 domain-containing protein [Allosphingosinicella sp.]|nr:DUF4241 domain-containing protein [Allosphingosinicella sp.]